MPAGDDAAKEKSAPTRADFVRQFPLTVPSKDIVAKAKEQGLDIPSNYVSAVRSKMRSDTGPAPKASAATQPAPAKAAASSVKRQPARPRKHQVSATPATAGSPPRAAAQGVDREFLKLVLDIGLVRAEELLENVRARLASLR